MCGVSGVPCSSTQVRTSLVVFILEILRRQVAHARRAYRLRLHQSDAVRVVLIGGVVRADDSGCEFFERRERRSPVRRAWMRLRVVAIATVEPMNSSESQMGTSGIHLMCLPPLMKGTVLRCNA